MAGEEITRENVKDLALKALALNKDLGRLNFEAGLSYMQKIKDSFLELDELGYATNLTPAEATQVDNFKDQFVQLLNQVRAFDIGAGGTEEVRDNLNNAFINLHNQVEQVLRIHFVSLRQQAATTSQDTKELQRLQKEALKTNRQYKKLTEQLEAQLKVLATQQKTIAGKKGEIAAETFGKHFEATAETHRDVAEKRWYKLGLYSFSILLLVVALNLIAYLAIFYWGKVR